MRNIKRQIAQQSSKHITIRNRIHYAAAIAAVMATGLLSRKYGYALPHWIASYAGDVLWALMIFLITGFVFKRSSSIKTAFYAGVFSFFIEITQLYHATWIDSIRRTALGALVLGFGFLWSDLACYLIGIVIGFSIEKLFLTRLQH